MAEHSADQPFVHLEPAAEHVQVPDLLIALHSPMDAGGVAQVLAEHLVGSLKHERIATFDADALTDFNRRRPTIVYEDGRFTDMHSTQTVLDVIRDDEGTQILLLHGPEPDLRWNQFTSEVLELAQAFGVRRAIAVQGFPTAVPHTRPIQITAHASRPGLLDESPGIIGTLQFPAQMVNALEYAFGESGVDAVGFSAAIPHYLAQYPYPAAAAALVRRVAQAGDFALPVGELDAAAARFEAELVGQVGEEAIRHVRALEAQFDAMREAQPRIFSSAEGDAEIPTADEIGAAAEAFLADLGLGGDEPGDGEPGTGEVPGWSPDGGEPGGETPGDDRSQGDGGEQGESNHHDGGYPGAGEWRH